MKNLKELRKENLLSQRELAQIFSVTQQSIYKYENGLAEPSLNTLIQMANFFHTSIDYIVGRTNERVTVDFNILSQPELRHLEMYRKLSNQDRKHINGIVRALAADRTVTFPDNNTGSSKPALGRKRKHPLNK